MGEQLERKEIGIVKYFLNSTGVVGFPDHAGQCPVFVCVVDTECMACL